MAKQQKATKTFVRGSYLYLDESNGYQERENNQSTKQKIIEDTIGISNYQREIKEKVLTAQTRKKETQGNKLVQKPVLIPIRDTPVEPVPEPVLENQRCERAMEQQFDYFQNYISQKEKEKKFEEQQTRRINQFLVKQKKFKEKDAVPVQSEGGFTEQGKVIVVMEKDNTEQHQNEKKTKKIIKIKIKRKQDNIDNKIISKEADKEKSKIKL